MNNNNNVINMSIALKAMARLPDDCENKTALINEYYESYCKVKKIQLDEEKYAVTRSILDERPNFPEGLSKDQRTLLVLKHTIANELSRRPQDMVALAVFTHAWWSLKQKLAIEETDKRYPNLSAEEREANIHVLCQVGDPNGGPNP